MIFWFHSPKSPHFSAWSSDSLVSTWIFFLKEWLATWLWHIACTIIFPLKYRVTLEDRGVNYFNKKETEKNWVESELEVTEVQSRFQGWVAAWVKCWWHKNEMTGYGPDSRSSTVWSYLSMSIPTEINTVGVGHASCLLPTWSQTKLNSEIRLKPVQLHSAPVTIYLPN